jgi:hypothetical protein
MLKRAPAHPIVPPSIRLAVLAAVVSALGATSGARAQAPANPCLAEAPVTAPFFLNTNRRGIIDLHFYRAQGAPVAFFECFGEQAVRLGKRLSPTNVTSFYEATFWDCERRTRYFAATATLPDGSVARGTAGTRTMACADRFALKLPRRLEPGRLATVRVSDRWGVGRVQTSLCVTSPLGKSTCGDIAFARGVAVAKRRLRPESRGRWRVVLKVGDHRVRGSIAVGVRDRAAKAAAPKVLATGDSTMQGLESFLADDLGKAATVVSDVRPGLSLSGGNLWGPIATSQAKRVQAGTTVLSIGANEGLRMRVGDGTTRDCCEEAWIAEYARRMRATLRAYRRHGRGRVFVLTIAVPRDPRRVPVFAAVDDAIVRAATGMASVRVLRMDRLFSPLGYSTAISYEGRTVRVREPDGIHLNVQGLEIAARVVAQAMREG